ncbi:acetaldehyde dehydrogenase [Halanaerobium congolense]|uniref:Acetaldehyde dehydrogenase n=1 Tax=Halanaerobium congolense TaxID=54121 RepID=A0A4V3GVJ0_9FIRM|nr:acetaldehyde dehydrogenase (acetylating) [Halanaerobium congolense]TDX38430.1 acetaldehyde dehydrogenase [Halanaerobium congolense]
MLEDRDLKSIQMARNLVQKAKKAQKKLAEYSQAEIDNLVAELAKAAAAEAKPLAELAVEETGMGIVEDKIEKNLLASTKLWDYIKDMKTVGVVRDDKENKITEIASPMGVIAALVPSTNPTSTTIYKSLISLKAANSIVFSPHPSAQKCIQKSVEVLNKKLVELGAPEGLINCIDIVSLEGTRELMSHEDVSLILATGGSAMVKAAYSSGTPALGVGPGNVPVFIERSADLEKAVQRIMQSKTFDNGTICASEQSVVVESCIKDEVVELFKKENAYFLDADESKKVEKTIQLTHGGLNPAIVGKSAKKIAELAGIKVPHNCRVLISETDGVGQDHPFSREKLAPLLGFYTVEDWEEACDLSMEILNYGGLGHSLGIHSKNEEVIRAFSLKKPTSRMLVNTPTALGATGKTTNLAPSFTLGCGSKGGNATSDNITPLNLFDRRRIAYGVRDVETSTPQTQTATSNSTLKDSGEEELDIIIDKILEKLSQK